MRLLKILCITLITLLIVRCEKEEFKVLEAPQLHFGNRGIVIEWNPTDISGFKYYEVLRSTDGIHFSTVNNISSTNSTAFDKNNTSYTDIPYPFEDMLYYKVAVLGENGEELEVSEKRSITVPKPIELDFDPSAAYMMAECNEILFFKSAWSDTYYYLFDYNSNKIINSLNLSIRSTGYAYGFGKFNGNYECYFNNGWNFQMEIYDALNFYYKSSFNFSTSYTSIESDYSNYIYWHEFDNIYMVNRSTLTVERYHSNNNYFNKLYLMEGQNKLIGITDDKIILFEMSSPGHISKETSKNITNSSGYEYINGTNLIYGSDYSESKIINTDNWEEVELKDENNNAIYFSLFHVKNGVLYGYRNKTIYCYKLDNLELIEVFPTRVQPRIILSNNQDLFLVQSTFSGKTIIDRMKLTQ